MVPDAKRELACGVGAAHEGRGKRSRSQRRGPQHRAPRQHSLTHPSRPAIVSGRLSACRLFFRRLALTRLVGSSMAAIHFPAANIELPSHGFRSFIHPAFIPVMERIMS
jgi:hypothetical protein